MNIDYKVFARQIIVAVGGFENIKNISHCLTRIRIEYKNIEKVDEKTIKTTPGVEGYRRFSDQVQIIVGNDVHSIYKELTSMQKSVEELKQEKNKISIQSIIRFVSECMIQLFPGLVGCGMLRVILLVLNLTGFIQETSSTYIILYAFTDGFFYFLPIILGYILAKKLDGNPVMYMCIGMALCYPSFVSLMDGSTIALESFHGINYTYIFGIPLICSTYPSTVLPMFLMAFIMKWIEDRVIGIGPVVLKPILGHVLFIVLCIPIMLFVIGPIGTIVGTGITKVSLFLYEIVPSITIMVLSVLMPFIVASGMHYLFIPIMIQNITLNGFDPIFFIAMYCSNLAQGGAAFGISLKTEDMEIKSRGLTGAVSSFIAGITEIAMYGINLRYKAGIISSMIAAGIGGFISGFYTLKCYQFGGPSSLLTMFTFINKSSEIQGIYIGIIVAVVILSCSIALSFIFYEDEVVMKSDEIMPIQGERIELKAVSNEVFASGIMGEGYGILPSSGEVFAPFDGIVETIYDTKHILFLKSEKDERIMIHIGLNSTFLEGDFFQIYVKENDKIRKGQLLMEFDRKGIIDAGFNTESVIIYIEDDTDL